MLVSVEGVSAPRILDNTDAETVLMIPPSPSVVIWSNVEFLIVILILWAVMKDTSPPELDEILEKLESKKEKLTLSLLIDAWIIAPTPPLIFEMLHSCSLTS